MLDRNTRVSGIYTTQKEPQMCAFQTQRSVIVLTITHNQTISQYFGHSAIDAKIIKSLQSSREFFNFWATH